MEFTRRLTTIGGQTSPFEDWVIRYRGSDVGRVFNSTTGPTKVWVWSTWTYPSANGNEQTLEDALKAVKTAVLALPEEDRCRHSTPGMRLRADQK